MLTFSFVAFSQESQMGNLSATQKESLEMLRMADQLIQYGYRYKHALSLIQALEIRDRFGASDNLTKELQQEDAATENNPKEMYVSFDRDRIIADSKVFADGDQTILSIIKSIEPTRGPTGKGPIHHYDYVKPRGTDVYTINLQQDKDTLVMFLVEGDGDTILELYVYDSEDVLVGSDIAENETSVLMVSFVPRSTGKYKLKIVNRGNVYNRYLLASNLILSSSSKPKSTVSDE